MYIYYLQALDWGHVFSLSTWRRVAQPKVNGPASTHMLNISGENTKSGANKPAVTC